MHTAVTILAFVVVGAIVVLTIGVIRAAQLLPEEAGMAIKIPADDPSPAAQIHWMAFDTSDAAANLQLFLANAPAQGITLVGVLAHVFGQQPGFVVVYTQTR